MSLLSPLCLDGTLSEVTLVGAQGHRYDIVSTCRPYSMIQGDNFRGVERGGTLRGVGPWDITTRELGPDVPGETITHIKAGARTIVIPMVISADTEIGHEQALAFLSPVLNPTIGPCDIVYRRADGIERSITATYTGGADSLHIENLAQRRFTVANLTFRAHFPFWRQIDSIDGTSTGTFNNGRFAGENVFDVTNIGDVDTWPEITVTGPCENIELANLTTGQVVRIIAELDIGETVRLVTDPARRSAYYESVERWDIFDPTQIEPWRLVPGVNRMVFRAVWPIEATSGRTWDMRWPIWWETC